MTRSITLLAHFTDKLNTYTTISLSTLSKVIQGHICDLNTGNFVPEPWDCFQEEASMVKIVRTMAKSIRNTLGARGPYGVNSLCTGPVLRSHYSVDTLYVFGCLHYFMSKFIHKLFERVMLLLVSCKVNL